MTAKPNTERPARIDHAELCRRAVKWLINMGCTVAVDEITTTATAERCDAIGFNGAGFSVVVEVKCSRADFLRDARKPHRNNGKGMGSYRYFMAPAGMLRPDELPDGWGLVEVAGKVCRIIKGGKPVYLWNEPYPFEEDRRAEIGLLGSLVRRLRDGEPSAQRILTQRQNSAAAMAPQDGLREALAWQDISAAPKDGTWILVRGGNTMDEGEEREIAVVQWTTYLNGHQCEGHWQFAWYDGGYYGDYSEPTQWMPLTALSATPAAQQAAPVERYGQRPAEEVVGELDGIIFDIGGRAEMAHLSIEQDGKPLTGFRAPKHIAKALGAMLYEPVRLFGTGTWVRTPEGEWKMEKFIVENYEKLVATALSKTVMELRGLTGDKWGEDPIKDLMDMRKDGDE